LHGRLRAGVPSRDTDRELIVVLSRRLSLEKAILPRQLLPARQMCPGQKTGAFLSKYLK
jgi:hypothetical protein